VFFLPYGAPERQLQRPIAVEKVFFQRITAEIGAFSLLIDPTIILLKVRFSGFPSDRRLHFVVHVQRLCLCPAILSSDQGEADGVEI
jgi:hypothetical protein